MMTNAQRIAVNTSAQYIRTGLNVILSLYATRLVLSALGQSDYGIYTVIAGVVSMLAFLTNFSQTIEVYMPGVRKLVMYLK